jgi:polyhydroxyalkanoate synthesis regulator phasin
MDNHMTGDAEMNDPQGPTTDTEAGRTERASRLRTAAVGAGLGMAALVGVGAATATFAGAQSDETPSTTEDSTPDSSDDEGTRPERGERLAEALAPLVEDGTLTQEQADAVIERLQDAGAEARDRWGDRGPRHRFPGQAGQEVAELLGLSPEELREQLQGDATLADLAGDAGVTTEALVDAMLSGMREHLAERVESGDITQEEADERLAQATEWATAVANGERPDVPFGPGRHRDAHPSDDGADPSGDQDA